MTKKQPIDGSSLHNVRPVNSTQVDVEQIELELASRESRINLGTNLASSNRRQNSSRGLSHQTENCPSLSLQAGASSSQEQTYDRSTALQVDTNAWNKNQSIYKNENSINRRQNGSSHVRNERNEVFLPSLLQAGVSSQEKPCEPSAQLQAHKDSKNKNLPKTSRVDTDPQLPYTSSSSSPPRHNDKNVNAIQNRAKPPGRPRNQSVARSLSRSPPKRSRARRKSISGSPPITQSRTRAITQSRTSPKTRARTNARAQSRVPCRLRSGPRNRSTLHGPKEKSRPVVYHHRHRSNRAKSSMESSPRQDTFMLNDRSPSVSWSNLEGSHRQGIRRMRQEVHCNHSCSSVSCGRTCTCKCKCSQCRKRPHRSSGSPEVPESKRRPSSKPATANVLDRVNNSSREELRKRTNERQKSIMRTQSSSSNDRDRARRHRSKQRSCSPHDRHHRRKSPKNEPEGRNMVCRIM